MSKAFVREGADEDADEDGEFEASAGLPPGGRHYLTRAGYRRMQAELSDLVRRERPEVVAVVSWAASNGDRSENGDYLYGKKRLREIDRRIRYLTKRLESVVVVDPEQQTETECVYFGATVTVFEAEAGESRYSIVGVDEAEPSRGRISWVSPLARALLKARLGDSVRFLAPGGARELEIVDIQYDALD